jgi:hypothetical protein
MTRETRMWKKKMREIEEEEKEETELPGEAHMMREGPHQTQYHGTCQNSYRPLILTSCTEAER